jgi:hypothetical protein
MVAGVAAAAVQSAAAPSLTVTVEPSKITATGVSPGAQVLFFGEGFEPIKFHAVFHRWSKVIQDTEHGTVSYVLDQPVAWNAVWIVADLRTGHYAIVSTPGFPIIRSDLAGRSLKHDASGAISRFVFSRMSADFVYVAPGGGAWSLLASDGDANDADGSVNGETTIDLLRASPLTGTDNARQFSPGGTLFVIDPMRLDVLELKLDGSILAGAR